MKSYKESCGAEITVLLASFGVHRAGACLRRVLEGCGVGHRHTTNRYIQNLRGAGKKRKERKKKGMSATDSERPDRWK